MINEDKVALMVKLASYEQKQKKTMVIGKYFRSDYISVQMLLSLLYATISFVLIYGIYILYDLENFVVEMYEIDLVVYATDLAIYYLIFVVIYELITYLLYTYRYKNTKKSLRNYYQNLKVLASKYSKK